MKYLRVQEAAWKLNISEKTLRRWLAKKSIPYEVDNGVYLIPESAVAAILAQREAKGGDILASRVSALETQINAIVNRLGAIEARLEERPPVLTTLTPPRVKYTVPVPADVPAGALPYVEFARLHGVAEATLRDHLKRGCIPCIERPKANRPHEVERWLGPLDQAQAIRYWLENRTRYTPCSQCPHKDY